jgi:hypothetical protein
MPCRIHHSVVRGEIDNRVKGRVLGRLWIEGLKEPVTLDLQGNACPDLAGCLLTFHNPSPPIRLPAKPAFAAVQRGKIGDLTASRKIRAVSVPDARADEMVEGGEKPPELLANALYLEWFSESNGRVVIESTEYKLEISPPEWRMSPEDEVQRAQDAEAGWTEFLQRLDKAVEDRKRGAKDPEADWDEHDYERFMKESDARTDKYIELLEKYGDSEDADERIAREMGWQRDDAATGAGDDDDFITAEEMNRICEEAANEPPPEPDPHREGIDWIRTEDGDIAHPLQHRCFESAMKYWRQIDELGLRECQDEDLGQFISEFQITSAKLAGALEGIAEGRAPRDGAFTVAYLKRALDHLHQAQAGLEAVVPKKLLAASTVAEARKELFEIREGILRLMQDFRSS